MNAKRKTPLRRSGMSRRDWFSFKDRREPVFHPIGTDSVTTRRFTYASYQTQDAVDWESEQWEVHAALIPLEGATDALIRALQTTAYPLSFCPSWIDGESFDFAESGNLEGLRVFPWIYTRKHPVSQQLIIEPRQDFLLYHALDARHDGAYIHPLDNITVLQAVAEQHGFYAPQSHVTVHLNYLRDYLAARRMGLLIVWDFSFRSLQIDLLTLTRRANSNSMLLSRSQSATRHG
jgi:hypothetical protein